MLKGCYQKGTLLKLCLSSEWFWIKLEVCAWSKKFEFWLTFSIRLQESFAQMRIRDFKISTLWVVYSADYEGGTGQVMSVEKLQVSPNLSCWWLRIDSSIGKKKTTKCLHAGKMCWWYNIEGQPLYLRGSGHCWRTLWPWGFELMNKIVWSARCSKCELL